jgi:hypothetical protein
VGKAESAYLPGVRVPDVTPGGVAERAGVRAGDVLLRVGDYTVQAAPDQVGERARRLWVGGGVGCALCGVLAGTVVRTGVPRCLAVAECKWLA